MNYVGLLLAFMSMLLVTTVSAQELSASRQSSYYTYIYEVQAEELEELITSKVKLFPHTLLQNAIDSFPTDSVYRKPLPVGHYFFLKAKKQQLDLELYSVSDIQVNQFNNGRDLVLFIHKKGDQNAISDAEVYMNRRKIKYNEKTKTYNLPKSNKEGILIVKTGDETAFYEVNRRRNNSLIRRISQKVIYSSAMRFVRYPFLQLSHVLKYGEFFHRRNYYISKYKGYLTFSQPKYRPNDTLEWKAFVTNKRGKPLNKPLEVFFHPSYPNLDKNAKGQILNPASEGAYMGKIILGDSLTLNKHYKVSLRKPRGGKVVQSNSIYFEDYQLDESTYKLRIDENTYNAGQSPILYLSGIDANGFNLLDSRVNIKVYASRVNEYKADTVFIADMLWETSVALDPLGETKVQVPDSIFPSAGLHVRVEAVFNNSNNETHQIIKYFTHTGNGSWIKHKVVKDSIFAELWKNGKSQRLKGYLVSWSENDSLTMERISFPYQGKLNPQVTTYLFKQGEVSSWLNLRYENSQVSFSGHRTADSALFSIHNPRNLPIRYTVYKSGNRFIDENIGRSINWSIADDSDASYHVSYHYIWAGEARNGKSELHVFEKDLNIDIEQPKEIYPGQKADIGIKVTDYQGKPVKDVNLMAKAVNSQFESTEIPDIPYLGKKKKGRPNINYFTLRKSKLGLIEGISQEWSSKMGLDSIPYYAFSYPEKELILHYDSVDISNAQFSPFVFHKGYQDPIYMIYLDNELLYYYDTDVPSAYSFVADSGWHELRLRTRTKVYTLDSIYLKKGYKLDLSFDREKFPKEIKAHDATHELSSAERKQLKRSLLSIKNNFRYQTTYFWQGDRVYVIYPGSSRNEYSYTLGPFNQDSIHFVLQDAFETSFLFEPGFDYLLKEDMIKMTQEQSLNLQDYLPRYVNSKPLGEIVSPVKIERKTKKSIWESAFFISYPNQTSKEHGTLLLEYSGDSLIHTIRLSKMDTSYDERYYRGSTREFYQLSPGYYQILMISSENSYLLKDSMYIKANGSNFYRLNDNSLTQVDSISVIHDDAPGVEYFNSRSNAEFNFSSLDGKGMIKGKLTDKENGEPVAFAKVILLNGNYAVAGAFTDFDGKYALPNIATGTYDIRINSLDYQTTIIEDVIVQDYRITFMDVALDAPLGSIQELQVVAYSRPLIDRDGGASGRSISRSDIARLPSRSLERVAGTVGGVSVRGSRGAPEFQYIDGIAVRGSSTLPRSQIAIEGYHTPVLDEFSEGEMGSKDAPDYTSNSLRKNFKDHAYWQPNLITNEDGEVKFSVTFPDNVTQWKTLAVGMDANKHSGIGVTSIRSYKKLLGQLATPRFLCEGDQTEIIGKGLNYSSKPVKINTSFVIDGRESLSNDTVLESSVIDFARITASKTDTLKVQYKVRKLDGYMDGEEREIPVFPVGFLESKGTFHVLNSNDTSIQIPLNDAKNEVEVYIDNSPLAPLLEDIEFLKEYPYQCMEQTASKLIGYLYEEKIKELQGRPASNKMAIRKLIRRLQKSQNDDGGWGWWPTSSTDIWMTAYVTKALHMANERGFDIDDLDKAVQCLLWHIDVMNTNELLYSLSVLSEMNVKLAYASHLKKIEADSLSSYQKFMLVKVKQATQIPYSINSILESKKETALGNFYWSGEKYHWYGSTIKMTQMAYQIIERYDSLHPDLSKIRNYFTELKRYSTPYNTIDRAGLVQTILPGMLREFGDIDEPASVKLPGIEQTEIQDFPYKRTLAADAKSLTVQKDGPGYVYVSAFEKRWNSRPEVNDSTFAVKTWFEKDGEKVDTLKAGVPVVLKTQVTVKKKGAFVMIEVPIPAGCSYGNNDYVLNYVEAHREYFKHKTSIFCRNLEQGVYTFSINLEPRFSGHYTLNPAKAELMYFPTFFGNNEVQQVNIVKVR